MLHFMVFFIFSMCSIFASDVASNDPNKILDGAIIISLQRNLNRFEVTKKYMEAAGFTNVQRFEAIDALSVEEAFFESLNIYSGRPGQKGCAASHLLVWENFLKSSEKEWLFVAEDDMLPHTDFAKLFPLYWEQTPKTFDLVMVGSRMEVDPSMPLIVSKPCFCAHSYIISKNGAEKLLKAYKAIQQDDYDKTDAIDNFLNGIMSKRLFVDPPLVYFCYNGTHYKDFFNMQRGSIWETRDSGICFQNKVLGSSILETNVLVALSESKIFFFEDDDPTEDE